MDLEMTQALENASEEQEDPDECNCAVLKIYGTEGKVGTFQLKKGANVIGRLSTTDICLDVKAVSQKHLCLHVHRDYILIEDLGSRNKTRKGKVTLIPHVRYNLECGEEIYIGGTVRAQVFKDLSEQQQDTDDSDTCSESLLPPLEHAEGGPASQASTVACSSPSSINPFAKADKEMGSDEHEMLKRKMDVEFSSPGEFSRPPMPDLNFTQQEKLTNETDAEGFRNLPTQVLPSHDVRSDIPTQLLDPITQGNEGLSEDEGTEFRIAPTQALSERIPNEEDFHLAVTQDLVSLHDGTSSQNPQQCTSEAVGKDADVSPKPSLCTYFLASNTNSCEESLVHEETQVDCCPSDEVYCAATQDFCIDTRAEKEALPGSTVSSPRNSVQLTPTESLEVVPESDEERDGDTFGLLVSEHNVTTIDTLSDPAAEKSKSQDLEQVPVTEMGTKTDASQYLSDENADDRLLEKKTEKFCGKSFAGLQESEASDLERPDNNNGTETVRKDGYEEDVVMPEGEEVAQNKRGHMDETEEQETGALAQDAGMQRKKGREQSRAETPSSSGLSPVRKTGRKNAANRMEHIQALDDLTEEQTKESSDDKDNTVARTSVEDQSNLSDSVSVEGETAPFGETLCGRTQDSCSDVPWQSRYIKYPETQDVLPSFSQLMQRGENKKDQAAPEAPGPDVGRLEAKGEICEARGRVLRLRGQPTASVIDRSEEGEEERRERNMSSSPLSPDATRVKRKRRCTRSSSTKETTKCNKTEVSTPDRISSADKNSDSKRVIEEDGSYSSKRAKGRKKDEQPSEMCKRSSTVTKRRTRQSKQDVNISASPAPSVTAAADLSQKGGEERRWPSEDKNLSDEARVKSRRVSTRSPRLTSAKKTIECNEAEVSTSVNTSVDKNSGSKRIIGEDGPYPSRRVKGKKNDEKTSEMRKRSSTPTKRGTRQSRQDISISAFPILSVSATADPSQKGGEERWRPSEDKNKLDEAGAESRRGSTRSPRLTSAKKTTECDEAEVNTSDGISEVDKNSGSKRIIGEDGSYPSKRVKGKKKDEQPSKMRKRSSTPTKRGTRQSKQDVNISASPAMSVSAAAEPSQKGGEESRWPSEDKNMSDEARVESRRGSTRSPRLRSAKKTTESDKTEVNTSDGTSNVDKNSGTKRVIGAGDPSTSVKEGIKKDEQPPKMCTRSSTPTKKRTRQSRQDNNISSTVRRSGNPADTEISHDMKGGSQVAQGAPTDHHQLASKQTTKKSLERRKEMGFVKVEGNSQKSKKISSGNVLAEVMPSSPAKRTWRSSRPKVLFTGLEDSEGQQIVQTLGGTVAQNVTECTHLVTDKFRRTVKTLCCIAMGIPIITVHWLQKCKATGNFIDHTPFLLQDKVAEGNFGFTLETTLKRAAQQRLLQDWNVHVTGSVKPPPQDMKEIVTCAGGRYLPKMPQRLAEKTVIISCEVDKNAYSAAAKKSIPVVSPEFLLTGLLQHVLDVAKYAL